MRVYFGLSARLSMRSRHVCAVLATVPLERLLLESDAEDATDGGNEGRTATERALRTEAELLAVAQAIASAKGMTVAEVVRVTRHNAECFFGLRDGAAI